jgi:hypothetical protein
MGNPHVYLRSSHVAPQWDIHVDAPASSALDRQASEAGRPLVALRQLARLSSREHRNTGLESMMYFKDLEAQRCEDGDGAKATS